MPIASVGNKLVLEIIKAFGIDPSKCADFSITFAVDGVVKAQFELFVEEAQLQKLQAFINYAPEELREQAWLSIKPMDGWERARAFTDDRDSAPLVIPPKVTK